MKTTPASGRARGFTLVELLVVIGIIALLISILLPVMGKARESARTLKCSANLHTLGIATAMYTNAYHYSLPYPTTLLGGTTDANAQAAALWFNAVDPFLAKYQTNNNPGVAGQRTYKNFKQCVVYENFDGSEFTATGAQSAQKGFARTYKMNTHLRWNSRTIRITDVKGTARVVYLGDANSLDQTGPIDSQWENGQFSFEVNDPTQAGPAIRHSGAANILFLDGHVEPVKLPTITKSLRAPQASVKVQSWEGEYVNSAGTLTTPKSTDVSTYSIEQLGLKRNGRMPLIWSGWGKFYRPTGD